jgi:hypothetical protein
MVNENNEGDGNMIMDNRVLIHMLCFITRGRDTYFVDVCRHLLRDPPLPSLPQSN